MVLKVANLKQDKVIPPRQMPPCYHCGDSCATNSINIDEKYFCCEGCKLVYEIINSNGLCNYYELQNHPGLKGIKIARSDKYAYLDEPSVAESLYTFNDGDRSIVTFYIPGVHCSSCMWLLEHLRRLHESINDSRLNFGAKEVTINFSSSKISLRQVVELLTSIGYEPHISLASPKGQHAGMPRGARVYRLGVAAFCFSFIMMMSFPEYFGGFGFGKTDARIFRSLNLLLALPIFFFSAGEFFVAAWKGLKSKTLNIDAPIALAILITFARSLFEILSGSGAGYLDSMSGIVFFMLVGRTLQERTYSSISFHRDYQSYFPIAVSILTKNGKESRSLHDLEAGNVVEIHNDEIIPADGIVEEGAARIDYSFVTGESEPVQKVQGEKVYAGGKHIGENVTIKLTKPVAGSYLTSLWNHQAFDKDKSAESTANSSVQVMSRYFTLILFLLALGVGIFWTIVNPARTLNAVTAMLIVACPCALLLASTFTNGNLLRLFSNAGLYFRDASVIERLGKIDFITFDKTGTLTQGTEVTLLGEKSLEERELSFIRSLVHSSQHPYSRALALFTKDAALLPVTGWREHPGQGLEGTIEGIKVMVGSNIFVGGEPEKGNVQARIGARIFSFSITPKFRRGLAGLIQSLQSRFGLALLSGDAATQQGTLSKIFGAGSVLKFQQQPIDKLHYIEQMQAKGHRVLMIGDGLNDAGALQQSEVGITLAEDVNNFTPACDAILDASNFNKLPAFLRLAKMGKFIIGLSFFVSILYNVIGLSIAASGAMNPMIAAILMPVSTLSIVLLSTGLSAFIAWQLKLLKRN